MNNGLPGRDFLMNEAQFGGGEDALDALPAARIEGSGLRFDQLGPPLNQLGGDALSLDGLSDKEIRVVLRL